MNLINNSRELKDCSNYVTYTQIGLHHWKPIMPPSIFFAKVGAAVLLNRKRLVLHSFLLDNNTMAFSFDNELIDNDFIYTVFQNINLPSLVQVGALPSYNGSQVENINILIPTKSEQAKIGSLFYSLDSLITLHQRKWDTLTNLKKALLEKTFPKANEEYPKIRFKSFTEPWEQRKLGDVVNIGNGRDYKHLTVGKIPVYGTGGLMLYVNQAICNEDAIGIGRKGTIDKPQYLKAPFWTVDTLFYMVSLQKQPLFIFAYSQFIPWLNYNQATGVPSLTKDQISDIKIGVPSIKEQEKIGSLFLYIDCLITLHQRKCEMLKNIKSSLLEKMFL